MNIPMDTPEAQQEAARLDVLSFQSSLLTPHQILSRLDDRRLCFDYFATQRRAATNEGQRQTVSVLAFAAAGLGCFLKPHDADPWATFARANLWATGHLQRVAASFHPLDVQTMRHAFPIIGGSAWHIAALEVGSAQQAAQLAAWWAVSSLVAGVTQPYEDGEAEEMLDTLLTSYISLVPLRLN